MCPTGPDTCFFYQVILNGDEDLSHPELAPSIKVAWEKLCNNDLLVKISCVLGATQSLPMPTPTWIHECFFQLWWQHCSNMALWTTVHAAVYLAVLTFNEGQHSLLPLIKELKGTFHRGYLVMRQLSSFIVLVWTKASPYFERVLSHADSYRMVKSLVAESDLVKTQRKAQRNPTLLV